MKQSDLLGAIFQAVIDGNVERATQFAEQAILDGMDPTVFMKEGVQAGLEKVGELFENGECFLPELIMAGDSAKAAILLLMPHISASEKAEAMKGKVIIGSIKGDLHDIGKNIVGALLGAHGFEVVDLGTDVSVKTFLESAEKEDADIIAISTLLTTSRPYTRELVLLLNDTSLRDKFFIIVGGGPVTPEWVNEIGGDGYGRDANNAVTLCTQLLSNDDRPPLKEPICVGALRQRG